MRQMGAGFFFATCGIFLQSVTEWVFRATPMFMTFHVLIGALASLYYFKRHAARKRRHIVRPIGAPMRFEEAVHAT